MKVSRQLDEWVKAGLLSASQAEAIRAHEGRRAPANWALFGIAGVGIVVFLTGVVSVIAANWDAIPPGLKLVVYFLLQGAAAWFFLRSQKPGLRRECAILIFALLFLAGIGLVGQIYHLHSDEWRAFAFWLCLALPVTLLADRRLMPHLWFLGLGIAVELWLSAGIWRLAGSSRLVTSIAIAYAVAAVGLFHAPWLRVNPRFVAAARVWGLGVLLLVVSPFANSLWYLTASINELSRQWWIAWIGAGLASAAVLQSDPRHPQRFARTLTGLFVSLALLLTIPLWLGSETASTLHKIVGCAGFVVVWAFAAAAAVHAGQKRLFDLASFVIALRFIVVYFEAFGSLSATGIGLMLSGGVILGTAIVWHRYRARFAGFLGGAT